MLNVSLEKKEEERIYGLWTSSNDKTISKDIPQLTAKYHQKAGTKEDVVLPLFVLSKNYNTHTGDFELFIGSLTAGEALEAFVLPEGLYARITIKPKFGFAWGLAIGAAKRYFYTKWLPISNYQSVNLEYEYHTEKSIGRAPTVDVIFAVNEQVK